MQANTDTLTSSEAHAHAVASCLPINDAWRVALHDEVHARPPARIRLPALITYVAVLNEGIGRGDECAHLRLLPGQQELSEEQLANHFLSLRWDSHTVKWERHSEFTRYSIVQDLPVQARLGSAQPDLLSELAVPSAWLRQIPGRTVAAVQLVMLHAPLDDADALIEQAMTWFGGSTVLASWMGSRAGGMLDAYGTAAPAHGFAHLPGHSLAITQFRLKENGFERIVVLAPESTSPHRAGRIAQRLLELETYRLMALRGLPIAKALGPKLSQAENKLAEITASLEDKRASDQELLDQLVSLSASIERVMAESSYRFSATKAYNDVVDQRIAELREFPIPGIQTLGVFMHRRLTPAMATVAAANQRLSSLSERIARASGLLRTRVDIATETQNQQLLEKLTRGQSMQLRLQSTVEGLSIAAISYYVISLLLYSTKALKAFGLPIHPEMAIGALVPLVLWGVWRMTRRIHENLHKSHDTM